MIETLGQIPGSFATTPDGTLTREREGVCRHGRAGGARPRLTLGRTHAGLSQSGHTARRRDGAGGDWSIVARPITRVHSPGNASGGRQHGYSVYKYMQAAILLHTTWGRSVRGRVHDTTGRALGEGQ